MDLSLIQQMDGFKNRLSDHGQAMCADFVHRVLGGVMIAVWKHKTVGAVVVVDQVGAGDTAVHEGKMIVLNRVGGSEKI